jgi:hypothetical protein
MLCREHDSIFYIIAGAAVLDDIHHMTNIAFTIDGIHTLCIQMRYFEFH